MDSTAVFIIVAVSAWLLQTAMGWFQIVRFNRAFDELTKKGRVGVGKNSGRFKPKVIIALDFDADERVQDGFIMRGYTVFASPKKLSQFCGLTLQELHPETLFPNDKASQAALTVAIQPKK